MLDLFEIRFSAVGDLRLNKKLSMEYVQQYIKIMKLMERAYSFDNFAFFVGKEMGSIRTSLLSNEDEVQCTLDALDILESIYIRFDFNYEGR
jgi:hypothetical protein